MVELSLKHDKPIMDIRELALAGRGGNMSYLRMIGFISNKLKSLGREEQAKEMYARAVNATNIDELLTVFFDYIAIRDRIMGQSFVFRKRGDV